ncbi:hypothetical protein BEL01nite_87020 [Bradyrhizobium elkanii]|nr:hypothetical protein BEL01nite_87020 [Bradyrhizobium elkanii]
MQGASDISWRSADDNESEVVSLGGKGPPTDAALVHLAPELPNDLTKLSGILLNDPARFV